MHHLLGMDARSAVVDWNAIHAQNAACIQLLLQVRAALGGDAAQL